MNAHPADRLTSPAPGYVCRRLTHVPDLTALHAKHPRRYPHLLSSLTHATECGRYDILFAFPGQTLSLQADWQLYRDGQALGPGDFLNAFDREWRAQNTEMGEGVAAQENSPPFTGGWFIYLGYELATQIEPTVTGARHESSLPLACATRFPAAIIIDHATAHTLLVCETDRANELLSVLEEDVRSPVALSAETFTAANIDEDEPERFLKNVRRTQEYIRAGDVFQVNLSRAWRLSMSTAVSPVELYRRLCATNPAPFAGLMTLDGERAIIS